MGFGVVNVIINVEDRNNDYSWVWWLVVIGIIGYFVFFNHADNASVDLPSSSRESQYSTIDDENTYEESSDEEDLDTGSSLYFNGYECTDDCSGHEAGYEWAEENDITQDDVDNYSGNSNSFQEGMQSYIDDNY